MDKNLKKKRTWILAVCLLAAVLLLAGLLWKPAVYRRAEDLLAEGAYQQAQELYQDLNYRDAAEKAELCIYRQAEERFNAGDYVQAQTLYEALGAYENSPQRALSCRFLTEHEDAREALLAAMDESLSVEEQEKSYNYVLAGLLYEAEDYFPAIEAYRNLGDYADSRERLAFCQNFYFSRAVHEMKVRQFEEALEDFGRAQLPEESAVYERYCQDRLDGNDMKEPEGILSWKYLYKDVNHEGVKRGAMYIYKRVFVYVPENVSEDTKFISYFAGGTGEPLLYVDGLFQYIRKYWPNAILLFDENSGTPDIPGACKMMMEIANQVAAELGICVHDLVVAGSSNGCYTALHATAAYYALYNVAPTCLLTLDTGQEWEAPGLGLSPEEISQMAESGAVLYLFEQPWTGLDVPAIYDLAAGGCKVVAVQCFHTDHDMISRLAYSEGVFSWAIGEYDTLNQNEYTLCDLNV